MGKSKNKNLGTSYEYRVVEWFKSREGWNSQRIPLSGASQAVTDSIGGHDVKAWKENILLTIECKKRSRVADIKRRDSIEIKKEWVNKLDFNKDEILVVSTDRSDLYVFIPTERFFKVLGRSYVVEYTKDQVYSGDKQFVFKRASVDDSLDKRFHLKWMEQEWIILLLDEFVSLRETANISDELSFQDQIKRLNTLESALSFEKLNLAQITNKEKSLLYAKIDQLESGSIINPLVYAKEQFWLGEEAFVLVCPHCSKKIVKKDL